MFPPAWPATNPICTRCSATSTDTCRPRAPKCSADQEIQSPHLVVSLPGRRRCALLIDVPSEWTLIARVAIGFGLAFLLGFERELRGSQAGDRTFALVGASVTAVTATLWRQAPQAVAG